MKKRLKAYVEGKFFNNFILTVIVINSVILGLITYPAICATCGDLLHNLCFTCVLIFTIEMILKLYVYGKSFFKDGWNNFDFILVAISWIPTGGAFSSFRAFRVLRALRALRLVTRLEKLRIIVQAIIEAVPNVGWASLLLMLLFYIFSIMGTTMYASAFPEFFGTIGQSMFTLFEIMTLDGWATDIARPMMEVYPFAWGYFAAFILVSSFIVMNVIVGIVVNAISELSENVKIEKHQKQISESTELEIELAKLKEQIKVIENLISAQKTEINK